MCMQLHVLCVGEDDLSAVLKALLEVLSEWKLIGIGFGLKSSKLKQIEEAQRGNLKKCLVDVIMDWLNRNYDSDRFGEPSWRKMVEVVADPAAGDNVVLAKAIADSHLCECLNSMSIITVLCQLHGWNPNPFIRDLNTSIERQVLHFTAHYSYDFKFGYR